MSRFSGKCDLYDHLSMLSEDETEAFEIFKKRTGGVIYQHLKVELSDLNIEAELKNNPSLQRISHVKEVPDKRTKSGTKEVVNYTYKYLFKDYDSLEELNKHGYYHTKKIQFETLLDLVPYYPYIIGSMASDQDKETVFISSESYIDSQEKEYLKYGIPIDALNSYRKSLQEHYKTIILKGK